MRNLGDDLGWESDLLAWFPGPQIKPKHVNSTIITIIMTNYNIIMTNYNIIITTLNVQNYWTLWQKKEKKSYFLLPTVYIK